MCAPADLSISFFVPFVSKATSSSASPAMGLTDTTVPRPKAVCSTRSPAASSGRGAAFAALGAALRDDAPPMGRLPRAAAPPEKPRPPTPAPPEKLRPVPPTPAPVEKLRPALCAAAPPRPAPKRSPYPEPPP